jgi:chromosome segregation ATPase
MAQTEKPKKNALKKFKSLFVVDDEEKDQPVKQNDDEEQEKPTPTSEVKCDGKVDPQIMKMLKKVLAKNKLDGFEYLAFRDVYDNMDLDNEDTKFKAAMASVTAMKGNVDILMTSAKQYLRTLAEQRTKAEKTVSDANDETAEKEKQISDIQKQMDDLKAQQESLKSDVAKEKADTANTKASFDATCEELENEINADIERFKKYKK